MAGFSNTYETRILETVFLGADPTAWQVGTTGSFYVALFNTVPADDGSAATEVSGNAYSRAEIEVANLTVDSTAGSVQNTVDVDFPIPSDTWGTIQGFGIYTQPTSGTLVAFDSFDFPITGDVGAQIKFSPGNLKLILD